jgi:hypothetical protein
MIEPVYRGFDGLDVTFQGRIPEALCAELEASKAMAAECRRPILCEWRGQSFHVAETGAAGGYAFRCDTGPEGAVWFFSKNQKADGWNIRVSCRSAWLATKGFGRVRAEIYTFLEAIGADVMGESIARVDYAVDIAGRDLPGFVLEPNNFVMHSKTGREDHAEDIGMHGVSGRYTSVTIGGMPRRQVIIYDKTKEVAARQKLEWPVIWNDGLIKQGRAPLADGERVFRVELRAGKDFLKDRWGITTWAQLDEKLGDLFAAAMADIRYCEPNGDTNRARWPLHPIWKAVTEAVAGDLFEMTSGAMPGVVKEVRRSQLAQTMSAMILGLLATWSLATATKAEASILSLELGDMAETYITENRSDFAAKIKRAADKYVFIMEGSNAGFDTDGASEVGGSREASSGECRQGGRGGPLGSVDDHRSQCPA